MTPFLVIGYGNELRGDDAVGPQVAQCVSAWSRSDVVGIAVHQLTPELAAILAQVELVIFVDASADPAKWGRFVTCQSVRQVTNLPHALTGHTSDPRWLLALTEALFERRPEAWLVTVPASDFSLGEPLSPVARAGVDVALLQINRLLRAARVMAPALATHFLAFTS